MVQNQIQDGQIKIPVETWKTTEQIACNIMSAIVEYSGVEVEISNDTDYEVEGDGFKWIEGTGFSIKVKGDAPAYPVHDLLRNNGFRLIVTTSNIITDEEWEVGEKWEKTIHSDGITIAIQADVVYIENSKGATKLSSVSIYPIMNAQREEN